MTIPTLTSILISAMLHASPPGWRTATVTAYCSKCRDGGYSKSVAYKFKVGTCASDKCWPKGTKLEFAKPVGKILVVNNRGGAIKGKDRFDLCLGIVKKCRCNQWGKRRVRYRCVRRQ